MRNSILLVASAMACHRASARPNYSNNGMYYAARVTKTVVKKAIKVNTLNKHMSMAMSFLRTDKPFTVREYAKMTGLGKKQDKAELDVFSPQKGNPIQSAIYGNDTVYVLR
jgi:hypothetical protein